MLAEQTVEEIIQIVAAYPQVKRVYVYGSQSNGEVGLRSDIDLAIEAPAMSAREFAVLRMNLEKGLNTLLPLDIVRWDEAEEEFCLRVRRSGSMIFGPEVKVKHSLTRLDTALKRLQIALEVGDGEALQVDATIHRFEFAMDMYYKALKKLLLLEGIRVTSPREAFSQAYLQGWLEDEGLWLQILADRTEAGEIYTAPQGQRLFYRIKTYFPCLKGTRERL